MEDHDYGITALHGVCDDGLNEAVDIEIDKQMSKADKINQPHTPIKSPHPKKHKKGNQNPHGESISETILQAVNFRTEKVDAQTGLFLKFKKKD